jgi:hypothetical protein
VCVCVCVCVAVGGEDAKLTSVGNFFEYIYYDADNERMRVDEFADVEHTRFNASMVFRYDEGVLYYILSSGCYYLELTPPFNKMPPSCVPQGLPERKFTIGFGIPCSGYRFRRSFGGFNLQDEFTVMHSHEKQSECVPLRGSFIVCSVAAWCTESVCIFLPLLLFLRSLSLFFFLLLHPRHGCLYLTCSSRLPISLSLFSLLSVSLVSLSVSLSD